jgi:hypothetical protein
VPQRGSQLCRNPREFQCASRSHTPISTLFSPCRENGGSHGAVTGLDLECSANPSAGALVDVICPLLIVPRSTGCALSRAASAANFPTGGHCRFAYFLESFQARSGRLACATCHEELQRVAFAVATIAWILALRPPRLMPIV